MSFFGFFVFGLFVLIELFEGFVGFDLIFLSWLFSLILLTLLKLLLFPVSIVLLFVAIFSLLSMLSIDLNFDSFGVNALLLVWVSELFIMCKLLLIVLLLEFIFVVGFLVFEWKFNINSLSFISLCTPSISSNSLIVTVLCRRHSSKSWIRIRYFSFWGRRAMIKLSSEKMVSCN